MWTQNFPQNAANSYEMPGSTTRETTPKRVMLQNTALAYGTACSNIFKQKKQHEYLFV
jgi:hypothetical protein